MHIIAKLLSESAVLVLRGGPKKQGNSGSSNDLVTKLEIHLSHCSWVCILPVVPKSNLLRCLLEKNLVFALKFSDSLELG